jgi:glycine cleavage system H lipoate-binding protein
MRCPFLQETTVRYCGGESGHRVFLRADEDVVGSRCLGESWSTCPTAREHFAHEGLQEPPARHRCPLLRERLVHYCEAAAVRTYVPYVHGLLSRCQNDGYRYCPLYLQRERALVRMQDRSCLVRDLVVATDRPHTTNHMWIDEGDLGQCHVGVDALVAWIFDRVSIVHFTSRRGLGHPHVIIGNDRIQLDLEYPEELEITEANAHLRRHPEALLEDPYGAGWLFEGQLTENHRHSPEERGLIPAALVERWMSDELDRLDSFVHDHLLPTGSSTTPTCADGGQVHGGLTHALTPMQSARLFHEFFRTNARGQR